MSSLIVVEEDGVRRITLNRPERRNAMTPEMQEELMLAMDEAATSDCRVVVFAGAGEAFCAGLDLSALQGMNDKLAAEHTGTRRGLRGCFGRCTSCLSRRSRWCMGRRSPGERGWRRCATLRWRRRARSLGIRR